MYQNRATLIGFLGKDAGVHATKTKQTPYTILSLATKRSWKDRESGERMSETTWHKCVAWGKLADFAASLTKGMHLRIEGNIRIREYTQPSGGKDAADAKKTVTEIRVTSISKLDRPSKSVGNDGVPLPEEVPA